MLRRSLRSSGSRPTRGSPFEGELARPEGGGGRRTTALRVMSMSEPRPRCSWNPSGLVSLTEICWPHGDSRQTYSAAGSDT
jgi:hypothetical protein